MKPKLSIPPKGSHERLYLVIALAALLLLVVPASFTYLTWHGFGIDTREVEAALAPQSDSGRTAQMLLRLGEPISRGDHSVRRWYPRIAELAASDSEQVRAAAAWVMGKDPSAGLFREPLRRLLDDPAIPVQRAAAISAAAFGEERARPALERILHPLPIRAPAAGKVEFRARPGDSLRPITLLCLIGGREVTAGIRGTVVRLAVEDGSEVAAGQVVMEIDGEPDQRLEARRALARLNSGNR